MRRLTLVSVLLALAIASSAHAVEYTVDFSTGPDFGTPITNEYVDQAFVQFFAADYGFRPARRQHGKAQEIAADVGPSRCAPDGGQGSDCEFVVGGTTFQLTRTATSLTLDAGLFSQPSDTVTVQLLAYRAGESTPVATSPVTTLSWTAFPLGADNIETPVSVSSQAGDIQRVELVVDGPGEVGAEVGFDDLVIDYPANQVPDVALSASTNPYKLYQGSSVDIPISIVRVNGSDGELDAAVTGLPAGVTATVLPDPVPGTGSQATLRLTAADDVEPFFQPDDVTLTMTPQSAAVAPAPRSVDVSFTVRQPFGLGLQNSGFIRVPHCAPSDNPVLLNRDPEWASTHTVTLEVVSAPPGVNVEFVPDATVGPTGSETGPTILRATRSASTPIAGGSAIQVRATSPGAPTRTGSFATVAEQPTATLDPTTLHGAVPSRLQPGGRIRLVGNGFCPGTQVRVGNDLARVDTEPDPGAPQTALYFRVPRLGTAGAVRVYPPGTNTFYDATPNLSVGSTRSNEGFSFRNFGWGNLSIGEVTDVFGVDEMFYSPNPCWPVYDCSLPTPIPDPLAFAKWQAIEQAAQSSDGHCFGINRFLQEVGARRIRPGDFQAGATRTYDLGRGSVESYLDGRHVGQFSGEFIAAYLTRSKSVSAQLDRARSELAAGRLPGIIVKKDLWTGHVVTAHDIEERADGTTVIWVYDNNVPFEPAENNADGQHHLAREEHSKIVINAAKTAWTFNDWSGGGATIYTTPLTDWPAGTGPTLPGIGSITSAIIFGSADGSATAESVPEGVDVLPALDSNAIPGAGGVALAPQGSDVVSVRMKGHKDGAQHQAFIAPGFFGSLRSPTAAGSSDEFAGDASEREVSFEGSVSRPVELQVATDAGTVARLATVETIAGAGGTETLALRGSRIVYEHEGPATKATITLTSLAENGGRGQFTSGPVEVRKGEKLTVKPANWGTLAAAKVVGSSDAGRRVLRLRSRATIGVKIASLKVKGRRARVSARFAKVPQGAVAGVTLRLTRGKRRVAKLGSGISDLANGRRTFTFALPRRRADRLIADVVVTAGTDTARASKQVRLQR